MRAHLLAPDCIKSLPRAQVKKLRSPIRGAQAGANLYAVNSDGKTPYDVIKDVDKGNMTDTLLQFGFTPRANAAAKTQAHLSLSFFVPTLPKPSRDAWRSRTRINAHGYPSLP